MVGGTEELIYKYIILFLISKMNIIYQSRSTIIGQYDDRIIKTIKRCKNEQEPDIQKKAAELNIAPHIYNTTFDNFTKKMTIEMEFVDGEKLDDILKLPGINKNRIKCLLISTSDKLYDAGIDHRDLSSNNIIISEKKGLYRLRILDYGSAILYPFSIPEKKRDYSFLVGKDWNQ
jgi:tRNA A-37 threonylcarbamoyl transferase component Bud32